MVTRVESAAATRRALLDATAQLLDLGGPAAVTLREVGSRAGVSRGAPYRHFEDKEDLLNAVAAHAWEGLGQDIRALRVDPESSTADKLHGALTELIALGRRHPHLYQIMFRTPTRDPDAMTRAARLCQDEFFAIVAAVVGEQDARRYSALLIAGAHGVIGMEMSGQLTAEKWQTSAEELVTAVVAMVADPHRRAWPTVTA